MPNANRILVTMRITVQIPSVGAMLLKYRDLIDRPSRTLPIPSNDIPPELSAHLRRLASLARVLDGHGEEEFDAAASEIATADRLGIWLQSAIRCARAGLTDAEVNTTTVYELVTALPVPRWVERITALIEEFRQSGTLPALVKDFRVSFAASVVSHKQLTYCGSCLTWDMSIGRPKGELVLSEEERIQLSSLSGSRSLPHALVARAKAILWSAGGASNAEIAARLGWTQATVGKWRRRFLDRRVQGLYDELRPGRPRSIEDEQVAALLKRTLSRKPKAATHWAVREAARSSGISKSTVHRLFQAFAVQPHRSRTFKLSNDPFFVEKVRDIAGLYLNPPDHALVLCVDEKSQIQALNRTQPVLPMGLGYVEGVTHDYVHHGTTTLFAALDIATGAVFTECKPRHRHQEFLSFLQRLESASRPNLMFT
jgi:transposase